jgi:hypothetical protein
MWFIVLMDFLLILHEERDWRGRRIGRFIMREEGDVGQPGSANPVICSAT